jgi:tetratricopeptide (TPR) repeat protein
MRRSSLCAAIVAASVFVAANPVYAATWCLVTRDGSMLCRFRTFEQCMQSVGGRGDSCAQDSSTVTTPSKKEAPAASKPKPAPAKPTEQPAKQVAPAKTPAAAPQAAGPQDPGQRFAAARDLILNGKYEAGIVAMQALGFDQHPDVAAYIGLAHSKLGRFAEATSWYDKALAGNPNHLLTLSYYGMSSVEQGDLQTAQDALERIKQLCGGTSCKEYIALQATIASKQR